MDFFLYRLELPISKKVVFFRELNNRELIALSKASVILSDSEQADSLENYSIFLKDIIFNCVKEKNILNEIDIIEYIILILKIRSMTLGETLEVEIPYKESNLQISKVKANLNTQTLIKNLFFKTKSLSEEAIVSNNIQIHLKWPLVSDEGVFFTNPDSFFKNELVSSFLETIIINDKNINCRFFSLKEKLKLYESLSLKVQTEIQHKVVQLMVDLSKANLFEIPEEYKIPFSLLNGLYQQYIKLLFSYDLYSIYQEYFHLMSKKNINPMYLDQITPAERRVYFSFLEAEFNSEGEVPQEEAESLYSDEVLNLAREFGEVPNN